RHVVAEIDGAGKAHGVRAAVALDRNPIESQERAAVGSPRIHLLLERGESASGEEGTDPRHERPAHSGLDVLGNLPRRAFRCFQGDVAGKALHHNHVDDALPDLVAFDEAAVFDREPLDLLEPGMSLASLVGSLDLLDADVEQPYGRLLDVVKGPGHGGAHQRVFAKLPRGGADIGADVQHDALAADGRPQGSDGGALDIGDWLQHRLGHGHQRAGVARGHGDVGFAFLHRFQREPHAGAAAAPKRLARLVIRPDNDVRMDNLRPCCQPGVSRQDRRDLSLIAKEQDLELGMADQREVGAWKHHLWSMITAHGVERYDPLSGHLLAWVSNSLWRRRKTPASALHALACETQGTYSFGGRRQWNS